MKRILRPLTGLLSFFRQRKKEPAAQQFERLLRYSQTLSIILLVILVLAAVHGSLFPTEYYDAFAAPWKSRFFLPGNERALIVVSIVAVSTFVLAVFLSFERLGFGNAPRWSIPQFLGIREYFMRALAIITGVCIAFLCYYSGGTNYSPFTPLLIGFGFIAVIFANHPFTKIILALVTVIPYVLVYNAPYPEGNVLPQTMFADTRGMWFATVILILSILLSLLIYRIGRPGDNGASTSNGPAP